MLKPGETFAGRYRVEREIGRGGIGVVFACRHLHTQEEVAVKVLKGDLPEPELVRKKFRVEWGVWQRSPSEHIVRTLDAGIDPESGRLYSAMELLRGETLAQRVRREGPLLPAQVVRIVEQVSSGLDAAHQARNERGEREPIVHRDLKPNNLFLTARADGMMRVKILDFGSAKQLGDSTGVTHVLLGTPHFMASEQLRGEPVCPQTDIWALGLIAYYCLVGRNYWRAGSVALDADPIALQTEILSPERVPPSQRWSEQGVSGSLPLEFDAWFLRCLQRNPSERFESAGEAAQALARALAPAEHPLIAPPPSASSAETGGPDTAGRDAATGRTVPLAVQGAPAEVQAAQRAVTSSESGDSASVAPLASEGRAKSRSAQPSRGHTRWVVAGLVLVVVVQSWLLFREQASPAAVEGEARSPNVAVGAAVVGDEPRRPPAGGAAIEPPPGSAQPAQSGARSVSPSAAQARVPPESESKKVGARHTREPVKAPPVELDATPADTSDERAVTESAPGSGSASPPEPMAQPARPQSNAAPNEASLYDQVGPSP
jgi:eukaryotic-like serine/threonine-protein kinase